VRAPRGACRLLTTTPSRDDAAERRQYGGEGVKNRYRWRRKSEAEAPRGYAAFTVASFTSCR